MVKKRCVFSENYYLTCADQKLVKTHLFLSDEKSENVRFETFGEAFEFTARPYEFELTTESERTALLHKFEKLVSPQKGRNNNNVSKNFKCQICSNYEKDERRYYIHLVLCYFKNALVAHFGTWPENI